MDHNKQDCQQPCHCELVIECHAQNTSTIMNHAPGNNWALISTLTYMYMYTVRGNYRANK